MKKTILEIDKMPVNEFKGQVNMASRFIVDAAGKYGLIAKKPYKKKKYTELFYGDKKIGSLTGLRPSTTGAQAFDICRDKFRLEKFLEAMKIKTLQSRLFDIDEKEAATEYIKNHSASSFVIKPLSLAGGTGIELNVTLEDFPMAWNNSISVQQRNGISKPQCIVQPFIQGFDVRISISEGRFASAALRLPAHIIGNGKDNIHNLIRKKNEVRTSTPYFKNKPIPINDKLLDKLKKASCNLDTILQENEIIILTDISNLTLGGESIDITETVSDKIKESAIKATAAIPELYTAGIDFMTSDYLNGEGYIIEMNTNANHTIHHLPLKGEERYPFDMYVQSLLIRHKLEAGQPLIEEEAKVFNETMHFFNLKHKYTSKIFKLTDL